VSAQKKSRRGRAGSGHAKTGRCRIIAGDWRGRIISFDDAEGLRPTTDRIRETVFNWLNPYIPGSHCLDCFAGSGVLGLEALSRGAADVVFIESNRQSWENLKRNLDMLKQGDGRSVTDSARLYHEDAIKFLQSLSQGEGGSSKSGPTRFDLVFLDPPFHKNLLSQSCSLLDSSGCLAEDAIIYVEHAIDEAAELPANWSCVKQKVAGQVAYKLYIVNHDR
jgi:16S rRNA (guanine966-N2)-methyltransferase